MSAPTSGADRLAALTALAARADEATELLRVLGNAVRLQLLCRIARGECAVGQLEKDVEVRQPALSQQLAELRRAGLVRTRRESRSVYYSIDAARAAPLLDLLNRLFDSEPADAGRPRGVASSGAHAAPGGDTARFASVLAPAQPAPAGSPAGPSNP